MMFVIRRLQELTRKKRIPLYVCFIDLTKAYDSVDQTLVWRVLARFGVPQKMILVIHQFHDGMRTCVRLENRVCSDWFAVEQGLRQGCVLAPVLFTIFLVHLRKEMGARRREGVTSGEQVLATSLKGMLYVDDAGVVSQSPKQLREMMGVIVVVPVAFGLTASEATSEVMC